MPRPLHRVTPPETYDRMLSTPAVSVCTTSRLDILGSTSATPLPTAYGVT